MIAHVAKMPYGYQVRIGKTLKNAYTKTFCNSTSGGDRKAREEAEEHLNWYCEKYQIVRPVKGYIKRSYKEPTRKNNISGFSGVYRSSAYDRRRPNAEELHYWCAHYYTFNSEGNKVARHKSFSVKKLGEDGARLAAIEWRKGWEDSVREGRDALLSYLNLNV